MAWYDSILKTEGDWDVNKIAGLGTAGLSLLGGLPTSGGQPVGYQGKIPKYTSVRNRVANTYDPDRRPGSGGQRYFSDMRYVPEGEDVAAAKAASIADAEGLAALNLANPARQVRNIPKTPVETTLPPNTPVGLPAVPTAQSMMPTTASPFTSPYQHIENDPTNPLNITPYENGGKVSTIEKALMNYDPGTVGGLLGLLGIKKQGARIKERPSFTEIDLGMKDPNWRPYGAFNRMVGQEEPPMTPKEEAEFLRMFGTDYIDRAGPKGFRRRPKDFNLPPRTSETIEPTILRSADERGFNLGGIAKLQDKKGKRYLDGKTDGMADDIPAMIDNQDPAALSDGEYVISADVVSYLGNGNSDAGAKVLDDMVARIRKEKTGTTEQAPEINPKEFLPA